MCRPTGRDVFFSYRPQFGNNAPTSDSGRSDTLQPNRGKCAVNGPSSAGIAAILAVFAGLFGCHQGDKPQAKESAEAARSYACGEQGYLKTELYGAIATTVDWTPAELECTGMPRPGSEGARLRFAGHLDDGRRIAIIVAMPGLGRETQDAEYASTVTLIEEGSGRFFNSADLNNCWTEVTTLHALGDSDDRHRIGGVLFCVSPLAEVNGESSVSLSKLEFLGLLDWSAS